MFFMPLRGSILRLWRGPSLGAYGIGVVTHWILYGYGDPSCADGAALLQEPTGFGVAHIRFHIAMGETPKLNLAKLSTLNKSRSCYMICMLTL